MLALILLMAVGLGRTGWLGQQPPRDPEVARILERLRVHKTDVDKNNRTYLSGVVLDAARLAEDDPSAARLGAFALARSRDPRATVARL